MRHSFRTYEVPVPPILSELAATNGKCPHFAPATSQPAEDPPDINLKFGRMFDKPALTVESLTQLGLKMQGASNDSTNPSGYTYLGQFIAHEITFDKTKGLPTNGSLPQNSRSPQIDLDSLYGSDQDKDRERFFEEENPALLKIGFTLDDDPVSRKRNDLFRDKATGKAIIADERNDENLAIAQVQVAFMRFHNAIVDRLQAEGVPQAELREAARAAVAKHFQWIVLYDYLERLLDHEVLHEVLDEVLEEGAARFFKPDPANLFMPLEFSAAAFRLGHSMVRPFYHWNFFHSELNGVAGVDDLFRETNFSGSIRPEVRPLSLRLLGRWIIDWRRFFDFDVIRDNNNHPIYSVPTGINFARQIDTVIDLDLAKTKTKFDHDPFTGPQRSLAVRNLLRGYALGLPTGEDVAAWMGEEPLTEQEITSGFEECFNSRWLKGRTPLWFYILREAEKNKGDYLGRVGSRIVAETLVTLIYHSRYSILRDHDWQPREDASRPGPEGKRIFQMVDLLHFADIVNPINL